jgi:succinoglycan biosynthesis protein ExoA
MTPFITIIVPVRNEERYLGATLRPLLLQEYDAGRYEVLVIDGQSTDDTVGVVRRLQYEFPQLQLHYNPRRLSSAARNIGVRRARGEYIVIVDGHCELRNRRYLQNLSQSFAQSNADCLGRPQPLEVQRASPLQRAIALARASRLGHNPGSHIYSQRGGYVKPQSVAIAYRRSVFEQIGLFDERFDACEDVEFNHRVDAAGMKCYLAPELTVHYQPRDSLRGLAWQMQRYGRGRARLLMKHPKTLTLPSLVPALFLLGLGASFALGLVIPLFAATFCLTILLYSAALAAFGIGLAIRGRAAELTALFPAVFIAIHVGAGWGVLVELMPALLRRFLLNLRRLPLRGVARS